MPSCLEHYLLHNIGSQASRYPVSPGRGPSPGAGPVSALLWLACVDMGPVDFEFDWYVGAYRGII